MGGRARFEEYHKTQANNHITSKRHERTIFIGHLIRPQPICPENKEELIWTAAKF